jgi:superfamily II DNA or RNA helicase
MLHDCHLPGIQRLIYALKTHHSGLDSSEMGTGKTWRALAVARDLGRPVFIVCLKSAKAAWKDAAADLGVNVIDVINYQGIRSKDKTWWIGGKKGCWDQSRIPRETIFIFDESHKMNGRQTWNAIYGMSARRQGYNILLLSATPASDVIQLRAQGFILGLHDGKNFWEWMAKYGISYQYYGGITMSHANAARAMTLIGGELYNRGQSYSVPLRDIVGLGFPENNIDAIQVESAGMEKIGQLYQELAEKLLELEAKTLEAHDLLTIQLRLRQEIELLKVPEIVEMVSEILESSNKSVVVFVNFRQTLHSIGVALGSQPSIVIGEQYERERESEITNFQNGSRRVLISTIAAGGTSINLNDIAGDRPRHVLCCPTFSAPDLVQALGRAHRLNSKSPTTQQIIFVAGTVEQHVYTSVKRKLSNLEKLTNYDLLGL